MASLFGPSPQEIMFARQQQMQEQQMMRQQQIAQQGQQFGIFAPLYQAGLQLGDLGTQAAMQSLFPTPADPALQRATAVKGVLAKYQGEDMQDPEVLTKIGKDLMTISPEAGLRAAELATKLKKDVESPFAKIDPAKFTPESIQAFAASGGRDYGVLKPIEDKAGGTEFERLIASLPPEQQARAKQQRLKNLTEGSSMPIPLVMYSMTEAGKIDQTAFGLQQVDSVLKDFKSGKLKLSVKDNFSNQLKTLAGRSDEGSRAFSNMQTALEEMRNARLNLNTGVQTEGDALRAINEFLANYDKYDTATAIQQFEKVRGKMANAYKTKQNRLQGLYKQYGTAVPEGMFPSIDAPSAEPSKPSIPDSTIMREFNRPENARWRAKGYEAFKQKFLERNQ
jgi:hypothetical protein